MIEAKEMALLEENEIKVARQRYLKEKDRALKAVYKRRWRGLKANAKIESK